MLHSLAHNSKKRYSEDFSDLILSDDNLDIDEFRTAHGVGIDEIGAAHDVGIDEIGATYGIGIDEIGATYGIGIDEIGATHDVGIDEVGTTYDIGISLIRLAHHAGRIFRPCVLCTVPSIVHAPPPYEPTEYSHTHAKSSSAFAHLTFTGDRHLLSHLWVEFLLRRGRTPTYQGLGVREEKRAWKRADRRRASLRRS
jgi:hypothetical protein